MPIMTLKDLFLNELKDVYSAEKQIVKALPKLVDAATSEELRAALRDHLDVTNEHVRRLEKIFKGYERSPEGKKCKGMAGLLEEGSEVVEEEMEPAVKDAAIISAAQRVEHYEMAAYGSLRNFAETLGDAKTAAALQETLNEEGGADRKLTDLAVASINAMAGQA